MRCDRPFRLIRGFLAVAVSTTAGACSTIGASNSSADLDIRGGWQAENYTLRDGTPYHVRGQILFTERDWTVLFLVLNADGTVQRGSGEGGTYVRSGSKLVFTHRYWVTPAAPAIPSLHEQAQKVMVVPDGQPTEPTEIEVLAGHLTINFGPSGNHMEFVRSSGP